ncbi:hypothetical protein OWR29_27235 [Actinoplanes sp. Pm04-4]|uniref:Helix-turn-helix domain-containing protein n=1 Tax=Paractinoplanes pyxinae TaxID=2997416 RepID=A0ABT4B5D6_9ACTN|nr:hypothetical protein [Actinoplanes pyxinae]MCY1141708.1 hypothetical protein [Actinoplanes pyxinae]
MTTDREVHPCDRFDWEGIVLSCRWSGLIGGTGRPGTTRKQTRGGIAGPTFKAVALVYATHANPDGSRVFPSDARVAVLSEVGMATVKAIRQKLIELGLLTPDGREGRAPRYRLTMPSDLFEHVEFWSPAQITETAKAMRDRRRGPRGSSSTDVDNE